MGCAPAAPPSQRDSARRSVRHRGGHSDRRWPAGVGKAPSRRVPRAASGPCAAAQRSLSLPGRARRGTLHSDQRPIGRARLAESFGPLCGVAALPAGHRAPPAGPDALPPGAPTPHRGPVPVPYGRAMTPGHLHPTPVPVPAAVRLLVVPWGVLADAPGAQPTRQRRCTLCRRYACRPDVMLRPSLGSAAPCPYPLCVRAP